MVRVTQVEDVPAQAAELASREVIAWLRANWVTLTAVALIVAQLWLKGAVLAHAYFRQDDWAFFDRALGSRLTWRYLMTVYTGHLMPGSMAYIWVLARVSLYDWTLTSTLTLTVLALSCLALLRVLRTLFGNRPTILILLVLYLFTPVMLPGLGFWSTTLQWVPTQLVIVMALNAHVTYVRTGRFWHAAVATAWIGVGMLFDDVAVLIPLLLLALTSAYLRSGGWFSAAAETLRDHWRAWVMYAGLAAVYLIVFFSQLANSGQELTKPGPFVNVLTFVSSLTRIGLIPAALGGPWQWLPIGDLAFAAEVPVLTYLAWVAAAVIIATSLWYRRRAWRAWAILAGWVFASAVAPLVVGRVGLGYASILGSDLHYLADSLPTLVICVGLAFLPAIGEESVYRGRPPARPRQVATAAVMAAFLAGSLWSYHSYEADTSSAPTRSYLATVRAAVAGAPRGSVIVDTQVPADVEVDYFGKFSYTSQFAGPLAGSGQQLRWTRAPSGVIPNLLIFDSSGRLAQVAVLGRGASPSRAERGCWAVGYRPLRIAIPGSTPMYDWPWTIELAYRGPSATLAVDFGGRWHDVSLPAGTHDVYVPALGGGSSITAKLVAGGPAVCVTQMSIGNLVPSYRSFPIPVMPVPG